MGTRGSATPTPATTVVYTDGACDRRQRGHQLSWQLVELAEIELAMLAGQWLDRRLADRAALQREVEAWQAARNRAGRGGQLAVHDRGRPHQAQASLPHKSGLTSY
jgi:hypothetical protein